jgi:hypothetical protein
VGVAPDSQVQRQASGAWRERIARFSEKLETIVPLAPQGEPEELSDEWNKKKPLAISELTEQKLRFLRNIGQPSPRPRFHPKGLIPVEGRKSHELRDMAEPKHVPTGGRLRVRDEEEAARVCRGLIADFGTHSG